MFLTVWIVNAHDGLLAYRILCVQATETGLLSFVISHVIIHSMRCSLLLQMSVCLLDVTVSPAKMAELIGVPFGVGCGEPRNRVLGGAPIPQREGNFLVG